MKRVKELPQVEVVRQPRRPYYFEVLTGFSVPVRLDLAGDIRHIMFLNDSTTTDFFVGFGSHDANGRIRLNEQVTFDDIFLESPAVYLLPGPGGFPDACRVWAW